MTSSSETDKLNVYILNSTVTAIAVAARIQKRTIYLRQKKRSYSGSLTNRSPKSALGREAAGKRLEERCLLGREE